MSRKSLRHQGTLATLAAFGAGALFAIGLAVAGMTQPDKVIAFLDVTGDWDPSLAFVMVGAIGVYFVAMRWARARTSPLLDAGFHLPTRQDIDPKLIAGAGLFGVGWGLAGYCPGPGITSLGSGSFAPVVFVLGMVGGMLLFQRVAARLDKPAGDIQLVTTRPRGKAP